jgi:hypothetical protein
MKFTPITLLDLRRNAENAVIAERMPKFRSILKYKGRTLPQGAREDFESLAMNMFHKSVRKDLIEWQKGKREGFLVKMASFAFGRALRGLKHRNGLLDKMKGV